MVLALLLAAFAAGAADVPASPPGGGFLLVHLRWVSNQVTVVRTHRVSGRLKQKPPSDGPLQVRLADAQGHSLWSSALEDPRRQRFEFPDDSRPGGIRQVEKLLETAEIVVRMPIHADATEFQLLGAVPTAAVAPADVNSTVGVLPAPPRPVLIRHPLSAAVLAPRRPQ